MSQFGAPPASAPSRRTAPKPGTPPSGSTCGLYTTFQHSPTAPATRFEHGPVAEAVSFVIVMGFLFGSVAANSVIWYGSATQPDGYHLLVTAMGSGMVCVVSGGAVPAAPVVPAAAVVPAALESPAAPVVPAAAVVPAALESPAAPV